MLIFVAIMALMFQSIFSFAEYPMKGLEQGVAWLGDGVGRLIPPGDLHSLMVDGIIAGVGAVIVFLPQICLLFLFIGLLEDTGYMARAAFLMDRVMSKVGLHGKSFIPMLSSFACAIPGIMATRTIESPKDRLVTILVAPLMSCSARLPVYTLLIAACIPDQPVMGVLTLPGLTMLAMYLLGIVVALLMAWLFKKTLLKGETPLLIMELPPYKRPVVKVVLRHMWDRSQIFLKRAGTVILGISILLWFLASYPGIVTRKRNSPPGARHSFPRLRQMQPLLWRSLRPGSAHWKNWTSWKRARNCGRASPGASANGSNRSSRPWDLTGRSALALWPRLRLAKFSSALCPRSIMWAKPTTPDESTRTLAQTLRTQTRPDGTLLYTPLMAVTLMVFYVFALQCASTVAIVRRETNSWKWPLFQWAYMGALAWVLAFLTYHGGRLLGWN